jgi:O-antigen ligase
MYTNTISPKNYTTPRFFFYLGLLFIGQTIFRPALSFTLSDWFFLISFCLTTSESLLRRKLEIRFPPYMVLGLFFFTIGGVLSSCFAKLPLVSVIALIKYLYLIVVWFWLGTILLEKSEHVYKAIFLWTSSAAFSGFGALLQIFWEDIIPGVYPSHSRMTGLTEHVNDLGGLTSIALIPAIMMLTRFPKSIWRFIYSWVCVILIAIGLVLSVSMSGVTALLVSLIVWLSINKITLKNIMILSLSSVLFISAISIQSRSKGVSILSRLYDILNNGFSLLTLQTRVETYFAAWEAIRKNPLLGVGLGPNVGLTKTGDVVHNIFLANWFESGLFGFLGILLILGTIAQIAYKGINNPNRSPDKIIGIALFSSYIAFLVLGLAQPIYYKRFGWISGALLLALYSIRKPSQDYYKTNTLGGHIFK